MWRIFDDSHFQLENFEVAHTKFNVIQNLFYRCWQLKMERLGLLCQRDISISQMSSDSIKYVQCTLLIFANRLSYRIAIY